jgi:hypothetical protein
VKYRYALNEKDEIVDVLTLDKSTLDKSSTFFSVDSKQELIPRLGSERINHFAHKAGTFPSGSAETYLHSVAKRTLYEEYQYCLNNDKPFFIEYEERLTCTRHKDQFGIDCEFGLSKKQFDLTQYFKTVKLETKDSSFIPDVMILNPETQECIYFEIAVTHYSTDEKLNSGVRIVEIEIEKEEDIEMLKVFKLNNSCLSHHLHNFRTKTVTGMHCGTAKCKMLFNLFVVYKSQKSILLVLNGTELENELKKISKGAWVKVTPLMTYDEYHELDFSPDLDNFQSALADAHNSGVKVKNCYLCKYHAKNNPYDSHGGHAPIFCKTLKIECESNYAASCERYRVNHYLVNR